MIKRQQIELKLIWRLNTALTGQLPSNSWRIILAEIRDEVHLYFNWHRFL
jgi:hypothetical protein